MAKNNFVAEVTFKRVTSLSNPCINTYTLSFQMLFDQLDLLI